MNFHLVGYGCTTCIGNSGPLADEIAAGIKASGLVAAAVLSGNRNFEGRINPHVRANYLASPPLCVAYAIAGTIDIDLEKEPLGTGSDGKPVFLRDVWPTQDELTAVMRTAVKTEQFVERYGQVLEGPEQWRAIDVPEGVTFQWDPKSTYIRHPTFFQDMSPKPGALSDITGARVLVMVGDSVTTDHISPAGNIAKEGPAAKYLQENGVGVRDFNSFGARRGNHEVMVRGTFANIRLQNLLVPGVEGGVTRHFPDGAQTWIYDAAMQYRDEKVPTLVLAGQEYGTGSSRDWAAKGPYLLGVRAVIAQSYERIHRSNLIGMGVLPLEYLPGDDAKKLGLTGEETFSIRGIAAGLVPGQRLPVSADGKSFEVRVRIDSPQEVDYFVHGGILQYVLRQLAAQKT